MPSKTKKSGTIPADNKNRATEERRAAAAEKSRLAAKRRGSASDKSDAALLRSIRDGIEAQRKSGEALRQAVDKWRECESERDREVHLAALVGMIAGGVVCILVFLVAGCLS